MNAVPGAARRRRTAGFGAIAVAAVLLTSACAAGRVAQTANQRPSIAGVNADIGSIGIRDLSIEAPPSGPSYPKGSDLRLTGVFVNNGTSDDLLTSISSASVTGWGSYSSITDGDQVVAAAAASAAGSTSPAVSSSAAPSTSASVSSSASSAPSSAPATSAAPQASLSVTIPNGSRTSYGVPVATGSLLLLGTTARIYPGSTVQLTLTFARAGTVTVGVPVEITTDPTQSSIAAPSGSGASD